MRKRTIWKQNVSKILGVKISPQSANVRIDIFNVISSKTKKYLKIRKQMELFCYLVAVAGFYKSCIYPDLAEKHGVNGRIIQSLDIVYTKQIAELFGKNGLVDRLGFTESIDYKDLPIKNNYKEIKNGEDVELFTYVKDNPFLKIHAPNIKNDVIKKPLFCLKKRVTNKRMLRGSFYDFTYTVQINISDIYYIIYDLKVPAHIAGFYYYLLLESKKEGKQLIRISNNRISKMFKANDRTIGSYIETLEKVGLVKYIIKGSKNEDRVLKIINLGDIA